MTYCVGLRSSHGYVVFPLGFYGASMGLAWDLGLSMKRTRRFHRASNFPRCFRDVSVGFLWDFQGASVTLRNYLATSFQSIYVRLRSLHGTFLMLPWNFQFSTARSWRSLGFWGTFVGPPWHFHVPMGPSVVYPRDFHGSAVQLRISHCDYGVLVGFIEVAWDVRRKSEFPRNLRGALMRLARYPHEVLMRICREFRRISMGREVMSFMGLTCDFNVRRGFL